MSRQERPKMNVPPTISPTMLPHSATSLPSDPIFPIFPTLPTLPTLPTHPTNTAAQPAVGSVWLVGAGPGDPDLLTIKAWRLMQQADVVLYDQLVAAEILALLPSHQQHISVGKARNNHTMPQEEIESLMLRFAKAGKKVLRLKGGDPFIFGRGGEELATLQAQGITVEVVPGITAALGAAAAAQIPLTHRHHAQSCVFLTAHLKNGHIDLEQIPLAVKGQTLVIYMGLSSSQMLCDQLQQRGFAADTAVALIEKATTPQQRITITNLMNLPEVAQQSSSPCLLIIGDVVSLYKHV